MSDWGTGNSWDNSAGGSHDTLQGVISAPTRASGIEGGWGKPSKYDDFGAGYPRDAGGYSGDTGGKPTGGCFVRDSEEHMKNECPDKPAGGCFRCGAENHRRNECPDKPVGGCFRCDADDHMKSDCSEPLKPVGECFNCGEVGHSKADCTAERVVRPFTGTCNVCQEEGHRTSECPTAPTKICKNCEEPQTEGHTTATCSKRRIIHSEPAKEGQANEAWLAVIAATDPDWDIDDIKDNLKAYTDACPDVTWAQLEETFRDYSMKIHLVAIEKPVASTFTIVDLQGNIDRKYIVWIRKSPQPGTLYEAAMWPSSQEENMARLLDAGMVESRHAVRCSGCGELGHTRKHCQDSEPPAVIQGSVLHCCNCDEDGHGYRDCQRPREDKNACRNCKQPGHQSREYTEARNLDIVECNKFSEMGHFSRDCPTAGGGGGCRNCDANDHQSRECPLPRDYSGVKCQTCQEMGHTAAADDFGGDNADSFARGGGDFGASSNSWDHSSRDALSSAAVPAKTSSSGWAKVSKGDSVAEDNATVAAAANDGGWGTSANSFESAPFQPAVSFATTGGNGGDGGWGIASFDNGRKTSNAVDSPWGIEADVVDKTTDTDRISKAAGSERVASVDSSKTSGGLETLKPMFYNDGKNRHISTAVNPSPTSMVALTSARVDKKNDDIPRAGGFGGGTSSPEKDDSVKPTSTTLLEVKSTAPNYVYQPARGPVSSALRPLKPAATPLTSSTAFSFEAKVSPNPTAAQDIASTVTGRLRSHSIVKPIVPPHMAIPPIATTASPKPVVPQDVPPGGTVGRLRAQSILPPVKQIVPPHMIASSSTKAALPPHMATPSLGPASDLPFRNLEHLERTPPPHGLDVFFDGKASESAVVDDELPTPTLPSALAPPYEGW